MNLFASATADAVLAGLGKSFAIIAFTPDGRILDANEVFCATMGYKLEEIRGKHHSMFADPAYAASNEYRNFWARLGAGNPDSGEYKRFARGGREVWLQASYAPVTARKGRVVKVVKLALDITAAKVKSAEDASKLQAISRSQAVIEFDLQGKILEANENFLTTVGYARDEVIGRQHKMFVEPAYAASSEYQDFWKKLGAGEFFSDEFKRVGKGGREIWLQATYNPIFDPNGRVAKVIKFASDRTEIRSAVSTVANALAELATGNLNARIERPLIGWLDRLRLDLNTAVDGLSGAMRDVSGAVGAMRGGTGEITQAADDLSRRTEQQAASLEETAAALQQITTTVQKTAEGAKQARDVVLRTKAEAEQSGAVVREAVAAMNGIEQSSRQIGQIIGVIDEIAFQTNLLALNAGVEAARAGEAGRGFAVVASEVRALAQRSADAAKEIKALISASAQQVDAGVKLVGETGQALGRIVAQVAEVNGVVADIASSAGEQATGLAEVNTAVNQMDQVTQQNAAMVEQTTAASHSLAQEAAELARLTERFRLGPDEAKPVRDDARAQGSIPLRGLAGSRPRPSSVAAPKGAVAAAR